MNQDGYYKSNDINRKARIYLKQLFILVFVIVIFILEAEGIFAAEHEPLSKIPQVYETLKGVKNSPNNLSDVNPEDIPEKHIIILHQWSEDYPYHKMFNEGLKKNLEKNKDYVFNYSYIYLNLDKFPDNETYLQATAEYLMVKKENATWKADLLIASGGVYDFIKEHGEEVFGDIPIISVPFSNTDFLNAPVEIIGNDVVISSKEDYENNISLILSLHPDLEKIYIVIGNSDSEKLAKDNIELVVQKYKTEVEFEFLHKMTHNEMLNLVSRAPDDSAILFLRWIKDIEGNIFIPAYVLQEIIEETDVPVYGTQIQFLGEGIVGGYLYDVSLLSEEAAQIMIQIIDGVAIEDLDLSISDYNEYVFDSRVLERFNIKTRSLPGNSRIEYQESSFWDKYVLIFVLLALIIIGETILIIGLIKNYTKRVKAEERTRQLKDERTSLLEVNKELIYSLRIDPLTGAYNRHHIDEQLEEVSQDFVNRGIVYSIMMADIDDFKLFNDSFGHAAGDEALRKVTSILQNNVRKNDVVCRWGGKEFLILFPGLIKEHAFRRCELIRQEVENTKHCHNDQLVPVTVTIGVTTVNKNDDTFIDVIKRADQALYEGKNTGKNKVVAM